MFGLCSGSVWLTNRSRTDIVEEKIFISTHFDKQVGIHLYQCAGYVILTETTHLGFRILNWEIAWPDWSVGMSVRYCLDLWLLHNSSAYCGRYHHCNIVKGYIRILIWLSHRDQTSKLHSFIVSTSIPSYRFPPWFLSQLSWMVDSNL